MQIPLEVHKMPEQRTLKTIIYLKNNAINNYFNQKQIVNNSSLQTIKSH
jgi:hypothetical protein